MIEKLRELCEDKEAFDKVIAENEMTIAEWSEVNGMTEEDFVKYMMCSAAALGRSKMQHDGSDAPVKYVVSDRNEVVIVWITKTGNNEDLVQ